MPPAPMAPRPVHHMDFDTLVGINKEVVALTGEAHEYTQADGQKLVELVGEVTKRADNQGREEAIPDKASLLIFKLASGQYFHAGNKRTALVAGLVFLAKNGYTLDITNAELASTVDRVGIGAASLDDLYDVVCRLAAKSKAERRGWEKVLAEVVQSHRTLLAKLAS